ncbi:MAG: hypothetical protein ACI9MB_001011 [Verrucomicrobiales bacterium]|jgi:hypothetical protein
MKTLALLLGLALGIVSANADLVAHWPLDDDATDATGNAHDGVVVGGTVNFGQPGANANTGTAASFPDNGHIDVLYDAALNPGTQAPDGSGSFTIALWANSSDNANFSSPFTAREDNGVSVNGPIIYNNPDGNWSYWAGNAGGPGAWSPIDTDPVPLNTWQHVAITYDSATTTRKMFLDGIEVINQVTGISANVLRDSHIGSGQDDGANFFWNGLLDDVGLWDEALSQADVQNLMENGIAGGDQDPRISVPGTLDLALDGTVQQFGIPVTNSGETQDLIISNAMFTGHPNFSVVLPLPPNISPGGTSDVVIEFDPQASNGAFEADLEITSNDAINPTKIITVRGEIHDPFIAGPLEVDFGSFPAGSGAQTTLITIENQGSLQLNFAGISFSGPDAANFSVGAFASIPGMGTTDVELTFDPAGGGGTFSADLAISSDDPITPTLTIPTQARIKIAEPLVAWWPLDTDSTDASGNGFDGVDVGAVTYGQTGANPATANSASFTGAEHIDVPWDAALNSADFSVTLWANASASGGGSFRSPVTNRDDVAPGGSNRHGWMIYNTNGGQWSFWNGAGLGSDGGWNVADVGPVVIDEWHHIAITYDSVTNTKNFYIDGTSVSTTNPVGFSPNDSSLGDGLTHEDEDIHIGGGGDTGTSFRWEGGLDDIGLFRIALTGEEITSIMQNGVASLTGGAAFQIITIQRAPNGEVSFTWNSRDGAQYSIDRSTDLISDWEELDDSYPSGGETSTFTDTLVPAGATRAFYRVRLPQ